jgi:AcrR family transcriptional regulator
MAPLEDVSAPDLGEQGGERAREPRRQRRHAGQSRDLILDAVERLMLRLGYGAVNTRSVALEAGMKPPLVHYHFATTENLLLEAYRRSASRSDTALQESLACERPLHALWRHLSDPSRAALAAQYLAMAGQHPGIREAIGRNVEQSRVMQIGFIEEALSHVPKERLPSAAAISMMIAASARAVTMEQAVGAAIGHAELIAEISRMLEALEPREATKST